MDKAAQVKDDDKDCQSMLWRLPPNESFSDWTLEIKRTGSGRIDTYHVHRFFLALGPRASLYFASMLTPPASTSFAEIQAATSQLPLDDSVADAVPDLLDFLYNSAGKCRVHSNNAVSLYYLADYLQMPLLSQQVEEFIRQDLDVDTLACYYLPAQQLFQQQILAWIETKFAQQIINVSGQSPILQVVQPEFLRSVILKQGNTLKDPVKSRQVAQIVMAYCKLHENLTREQFQLLTDEQCLPVIFDVSTALQLIQLEYNMGDGLLPKTSLKSRCVDCIQQSLAHLKNRYQNSLVKFLSSQSPNDVVDMLLQGHVYAKTDQVAILKERNQQLTARVQQLEQEMESFKVKQCTQQLQKINLKQRKKKGVGRSCSPTFNFEFSSEEFKIEPPTTVFTFGANRRPDNDDTVGDVTLSEEATSSHQDKSEANPNNDEPTTSD